MPSQHLHHSRSEACAKEPGAGPVGVREPLRPVVLSQFELQSEQELESC